MRAGGLRNRVTIRVFTTHRDRPVRLFRSGKTGKPSGLRGISGREVASGAEVAEATIRVWVRFRRDITAANRLKVLTGPFAGARSTLSGLLFLIRNDAA
jgi:head-tail adaptor